jgi:hypothetical protein
MAFQANFFQVLTLTPRKRWAGRRRWKVLGTTGMVDMIVMVLVRLKDNGERNEYPRTDSDTLLQLC